MDIFSIIGHIVIYGIAALIVFGISMCIVRFMAGSNELENSISDLRKEHTELYKNYWITVKQKEELKERVNVLEQQIKDLTADKKDGNIEL